MLFWQIQVAAPANYLLKELAGIEAISKQSMPLMSREHVWQFECFIFIIFCKALFTHAVMVNRLELNIDLKLLVS